MKIDQRDTGRARLQSCARCSKRSIAAAAAALLTIAAPATATQLIAPAIGTADAAMGGSTVGTPLTPTAAAFSNPAGITELPGRATLGLAIPVGQQGIEGDLFGADYDSSSEFVAYAPEMGFVCKEEYAGLRWGFASYGSLGSTFKSKDLGQNFFSTSGISNLSLMAAKAFGDKISVGASLTALFGQTSLRYVDPESATSFVPHAFTVRGGGIQGMFGLRYEAFEELSFGAGIRTPGMLWSRGDDGHSSGRHEDVELDLKVPTQIFLGVNAGPFHGVSAGLTGRWTDASTFQDSEFEFSKSTTGVTTADTPFIQDASDEWRLSMGLSWAVSELITLRGSASYADSIVETSAISPLLYDSGEWKVGLGFSIAASDNCFVDFAFGYSPRETRHYEPGPFSKNQLAGDYSLGGQVYMIGLRFPFGDEADKDPPSKD